MILRLPLGGEHAQLEYVLDMQVKMEKHPRSLIIGKRICGRQSIFCWKINPELKYCLNFLMYI